MLSCQQNPSRRAHEYKIVNLPNFFPGIVRHQLMALVFFAGATAAFANLPGGGTNGINVTLTDNGSTVTMNNGIMSIVCNKSSGQVTTINYTFNNTGSSQTLNLISGNSNGGKLYWENSTSQSLTFTYSLITDPAGNGGNYAEIAVSTTSVSNDVLEVHYSMLRGNSGFYVTPIYFHRSIDGAFSMGECRDNIYAGSIFNWMSVDAARNRLMEVSGGSAIGVQGAPVEVSLWINGIYSGQYEDKYKYGADWGLQRVWGWSSVGSGGKNVGLWNVTGSAEYYPGGPMRHELMEHIGTTILNMHNGGHYGGGGLDGNWAAGEVWTKVYGPYLIYCDNVTNAITGTNQPAQALYNDALAQAAAEQSAWPYYWFTNANYAAAANRGTVTGQIFINDAYNPNASESNLWVGLVRQPSTTTSTYDFENWVKPYQFWVKTDANGNFTIPDVIATNNYTLYAFGPGAAGTFQSQNQTGGNMPNTFNLPASPFSVTVTGGATNNLGTVTWTPTRVGPTVFEIGFPNRIGDKFKHGDDYWVGDIGPNAANPSPIWSKWLEYQFDYPSGPNYTVGQSRWTTDWNFIQPCVTDSAGNYNGSTSTITFNLASAPSGTASFYIALSSDDSGPLIIQVNGNNIAGSSGYFPNYSSSGNESDVTIRESNHGIYSDARFSISSGFLHQGQNTITINMRKGGSSENHAIYDYIRLELSGYIPPPPGSVAAYAGNNCNLICWPVTPGATSYNILRSTTSGSGYVSITNGVTGPVCGSGANNTTYLDTNAVNDTTYYYVVRSVNPTGSSTNSPESSATTPSAALSTSVPSAPTGLTVSSSGHHFVTLAWSASSGANFYSVFRSTLANTGGGSSNTLSTIILNNATTSTSYTDNSPTDGSIYSYSVTATSAGGTSSNSTSVVAVPLPAPPATAPGSLTAAPLQTTNITLNWSAVSGAVGYVVSRATSVNGTYTLLNSITETTYTDVGLSTNTTYYYKVTPVNAGGTATSGLTTTRPAAPASLMAVAGNAQVSLTWPVSIGATGYVVLRGTSSGNATNIIASGITSTNYTNPGLTNGTTYYYVVQAIGSAATSGNSSQASATPPVLNLIWSGAASAIWDTTASNWLNGAAAITYANGDTVTFNDTTRTNISISGSVLPVSVVFANTNANYTLSANGAGISGTASLVKSNAGTLR
jgi:fibronectin type 3 domain-containing protein